jgi:hypothetical protein
MVGIAVAGTDDAFQAGKTLGAGSRQNAASQISAGSAMGKVPSYGASAPETNYFQGGRGELSGHGVTKMQTCATATPDSDPIKRQECEAINFLARNPNTRPQFDLSNNPMFARAKNISNNAENIFGSLGMGGTGSTTQCVPRTITSPAQYTTDTCSSIREVGEQQCTMGRVINIDTDSNFQCDQTINAYETLKCRRSSNLTCTGGGDGCDQGGIVPNSWAGDMATSWFSDGAGNYILQFGTIGNNYWSGWAITQDRTLTFTIRDVGLITRFALTRASFDDWILVQVNGATVYVGPYGGDRLQVYNAPYQDMGYGARCSWDGDSRAWYCYDRNGTYLGYFSGGNACYTSNDRYYCKDATRDGLVQYGANSFGNPELGTSWNIGLNIDLRPYLRSGTNTIFMRVIVAGYGEGAIQLTTRQMCPLQCSVSTRDDCAALEARSQ